MYLLDCEERRGKVRGVEFGRQSVLLQIGIAFQTLLVYLGTREWNGAVYYHDVGSGDLRRCCMSREKSALEWRTVRSSGSTKYVAT